MSNKKVVFALPHSQRFEHLETYCLRLLCPCFTSYVLNPFAENKKSKTTTSVGATLHFLYTPALRVCQEAIFEKVPPFFPK